MLSLNPNFPKAVTANTNFSAGHILTLNSMIYFRKIMIYKVLYSWIMQWSIVSCYLKGNTITICLPDGTRNSYVYFFFEQCISLLFLQWKASLLLPANILGTRRVTSKLPGKCGPTQIRTTLCLRKIFIVLGPGNKHHKMLPVDPILGNTLFT